MKQFILLLNLSKCRPQLGTWEKILGCSSIVNHMLNRRTCAWIVITPFSLNFIHSGYSLSPLSHMHMLMLSFSVQSQISNTPTLSFSLTHNHTITLSLTHTHTHSHTLSLTHPHTHKLTCITFFIWQPFEHFCLFDVFLFYFLELNRLLGLVQSLFLQFRFNILFHFHSNESRFCLNPRKKSEKKIKAKWPKSVFY